MTARRKIISAKKTSPYILYFDQIDKNDIELAGGKGANLGEMVKAGLPVPPGFAVTTPAYDYFLKENLLFKKISDILKITDVHDPEQLNSSSKNIQRIIKRGEIPKDLALEIIDSYLKLSGRFMHVYVAVRSSATAEDLPQASFAGQQATFLNIKGEANLLVSVRECWASLFTPRAIFYRVQNNISHDKVKISVIVQKMIQSEASGVMFTLDPVTNQKDRIIIEAVWGLGETIVQGLVTPDRYVVQKDTFSILSKKVADQSILLTKSGIETKEIRTPKKLVGRQKITDSEVITLAKIADKIHRHYYFPQDIEWAKEKASLGRPGKLYIVQTRPVTTIKVKFKIKNSKVIEGTEQSIMPILTGIPASPGIGTGVVKILKSAKEINKIKRNEVLVAPMTSPDFVPAMKRAVAIITDSGGQTSHAAIVSRELGIPCVVGTTEATTKLSDGLLVSVDGSKGKIFLGSKIKIEETTEKNATEKVLGKTATKLYVNLGEPERAKEIARLNVDGVGLLRAEFMIANIGIHPKEAIKNKTQASFVTKLAEGVRTFCREFDPRPVIYRATDFKTNEYRSLQGGKNWEPEEPNPMLGYRGAFRYIADPEVFMLELRAIKKIREDFKNLNLMIPFIRSPQELQIVRRMVASEDLFKDISFKLWMMVELPVNVIMLEDFIKIGIDGVSIGSNDLTMLITGTDRDNEQVMEVFDERSPAVLWAIKRTLKICRKYRITSSICGQAPSTFDSFVQTLVKMGITSISVNPDSIDRVRKVIIEAEKSLVK